MSQLTAICMVISISIMGCNSETCSNTANWIDEAPGAFDEFTFVKKEILSNKEFYSAFSSNNTLFLRILDTGEYHQYRMPHLQQWFRKGRGYISMSEADTSFCFRECATGFSTTFSGYVYYQKKRDPYNPAVELMDSLDLGNGWFAHVVSCDGCGD